MCRSCWASFFFFFCNPTEKETTSSFFLLPVPLSPAVFWPPPKRPPWLIAYGVGSLYLRALPSSLHTVLVTGSFTVTISILKPQGQFPPCLCIWLYNLIANASPVSPAPVSGLSFSTPPHPTPYSPTPPYSVNLCLCFHITFSSCVSLLPIQPCVMNKLLVAWGGWVMVVWSLIGDSDEGLHDRRTKAVGCLIHLWTV